MPRSPDSGPLAPSSRSEGCLRAALLAPAVIALAPLAAVLGGLRRWRRGTATRFEITWREVPGRARLEARLDVPAAGEGSARLRCTDAVVRVAETLRSPDDVYHLVWRPRSNEPARLRAVGPLVQQLGDRVALELGRPATGGHTLLWLALTRGRRPGEVVDAATADPGAAGEPDALVTACDPRWAAASAVALRGPAVVFHLAVWVPPAVAGRVERILRRALQSA